MAILFNLNGGGTRRGFIDPRTDSAFTSMSDAEAYALQARPGSQCSRSVSRRVDVILIPSQAVEPTASSRKWNTPWMKYRDFVKGGELPNSESKSSSEVKESATVSLLRSKNRCNSVISTWKEWLKDESNLELMLTVPLPGHSTIEDSGWCENNASMFPKTLYDLGRDGWTIVALCVGAIHGTFLPRWGGHMLDQNWSDCENHLWSWVSTFSEEVVLIFVEMGLGDGCYVFNLASTASMKSLFQTLHWHNHKPETYSAYRQYRVLGFDRERIREWYERTGNPRFDLDCAVHETDRLRDDYGLAGDLGCISGFVRMDKQWHRFFRNAREGSRENIHTLLTMILNTNRPKGLKDGKVYCAAL